MAGYYTQYGYMGLVEGRYELFASDADYHEFLDEMMYLSSTDKSGILN